jgi:3-oxoacyl-[acyl-carrier-protein] synthase II
LAAAVSRRRVVVTGMGCVTPLGVDVATTWEGAVAGQSGVGEITRFDASEYPTRIAAEIRGDFSLGDVPPKEARRLDRVVALALSASGQAISGATLDLDSIDLERSGVALGSGIGGMETLESGHRALFEKGPKRVGPFTIPMAICNMSSGYTAIRYGLKGPNLCHVGACASAAQAIGEASRIIERGDADVMLAGGSEAAITGIGIAAFSSMRALSTRNDDPAAASRPFDLDRDGFVMGEGAAVLVLEDEGHARARGATVLAEVLGYAVTADAAHIAQPTEDAEGAQRCMRLALADAGQDPSQVDYLNAHATSTPAGDPSEARAIRAVFGAHAERLAVSSTKGMTGHLLGAAGAVEAMFCIKAIETGWIPPTVNLDRVDPDCALDHVANKARQAPTRIAVSNSFGFGGTNAALVFGAPS